MPKILVSTCAAKCEGMFWSNALNSSMNAISKQWIFSCKFTYTETIIMYIQWICKSEFSIWSHICLPLIHRLGEGDGMLLVPSITHTNGNLLFSVKIKIFLEILSQNVVVDKKWNRLSHKLVQSEIFKALQKTRLISGDKKELQYSRCGRTDKGVSSVGQVSVY